MNPAQRFLNSTSDTPVNWAARIKLERLLDRLVDELDLLSVDGVEPELIVARLADRYRDLGIEFVSTSTIATLTRGFVSDSYKRLALLLSVLELSPIKERLSKLSVSHQLRNVLFRFCNDQTDLTIESMSQSPERLEEFARSFLVYANIGIQGESTDTSRKRLSRIDSRRIRKARAEAKAWAEEQQQLPEDLDLKSYDMATIEKHLRARESASKRNR